MLRWAIAFFILALVAGVLGFGGLAAGAASIAKLFFWGFVILFGITLVVGLVGGQRPSLP